MSENNQSEAQNRKEKEMQAQMQIDSLMRKTLTDEARTRLNNVRMVKKELYTQTLQTILMLVQQGQVEEKISDEELKTILERISSSKREISIRRK